MGRRGCVQAHACPGGWLHALDAGQHGLGSRDKRGRSSAASAAVPTEACRALAIVLRELRPRDAGGRRLICPS